MRLVFDQYTLQNCCGIVELGDFKDLDNLSTDNWYYKNQKPSSLDGSPTGLYVGTFVQGDELSKTAFDKFNKELTLLYKSPPRTNYGEYAGKTNGKRNRVYIAVFSGTKRTRNED